jgi:hypothetical protein
MRLAEAISPKAGDSLVSNRMMSQFTAISYLSHAGIAFRIAQDMGFQKDPKNWISYDASLTTDEDVEIRRRIYWGCYISDKLISLILGRPVFLYYDDAEVEPMEQQPYYQTLLCLVVSYADHITVIIQS